MVRAVLRALGDSTCRVGTSCVRETMLLTPVSARVSAEVTDRAIGTSWALSSRRRAVTKIWPTVVESAPPWAI
jgi:hypothetical protein